jgi:WD40 repeat protein
VFYYANSTERQGPDQSTTWGDWLQITDIRTVDLSPDGKYLAVGGTNSSSAFVAYYENANMEPYPTDPTWLSWRSIRSSEIRDVVVSDDGYSVAAAGFAYLTLYYWANATMLAADPNATWTTDGWFWCTDMSADGDSVVAGSHGILGSLHYWSNARTREGPQAEDWVAFEFGDVLDTAISDDGNLIAASVQTGLDNYTAYFLKSDGTIIEEFNLTQRSPILSMAGNGHITAIGGPGWDSLYVFELLQDSNPPTIEDVHQIPPADNVTPDDTVMVYANVTDDYSGVKQVVLNYTADNETWFIVNMTNLIGNQYNGTIPQFSYGTNVTYVIFAEDNYNNTITTTELGYDYEYTVIPEFQLQMLLALFVTATLLTVIFRRRRLANTAKH